MPDAALRITGLIKSLLLPVFFLLLVSPALQAEEYREVTKDDSVTLPRDYYFRPDYRVQWWYFTGHLYDSSGHEFGYELTFFAVGVQKRQFRSRFGVNGIYVSHFAVTDVNAGAYSFSESSDSGAYGFAGADSGGLRVWVGENIMEGTPAKIHIRASGGGKELDLSLRPLKPEVLHGDRGYSRKSEESPLIASRYFSVTGLETEGTLRAGGREISVAGRSWFDREISSGRMGQRDKGWDWFGIQLDDGREIMLYLMRKADGSVDRYSSGTFVYKDGRYRHLALADFNVRVLREYVSAKTGSRYPALWEIKIPSEGLVLRVTPLVRDQEFIARYSTGNHYWEGACAVEGSAAGRAYVEMTGY